MWLRPKPWYLKRVKMLCRPFSMLENRLNRLISSSTLGFRCMGQRARLQPWNTCARQPKGPCMDYSDAASSSGSMTPTLKCKLFDTLVKPSCAMDANFGVSWGASQLLQIWKGWKGFLGNWFPKNPAWSPDPHQHPACPCRVRQVPFENCMASPGS